MVSDNNKMIVSAGHLCLDITPSMKVISKSANISDVIKPGSLMQVGSANIHIGGSVGNTGLALQRLGANVILMGKTGDDLFGDLILKQLSTEDVKVEIKKDKKVDTSYSVVLSFPGIDRIIFHDSGANNMFGVEDVDFDVIKKASIFHFGYPSIMEEMYQNQGAQFIELFKKVKSLDTVTSLDMALVDEKSESGQLDWGNIIRQVMPYVDIFAPSVEELAFMIDRSKYNEWIKNYKDIDITEKISIEEDVKPLADKLISWGAKIVLIKCGARGMF